ncbi:putative glycosyltransferase [Gordonia namibiensis NBRC 108229]|uniref:Putative glycosyltransferase n=1 Tax=Gordonia namibiensis NBRC 108229 TaxID=1208314 RepID=K6WHS8_9ACTN|nr:putative glycosyltransferase [Gordonia namibiensis NBRC 108229]
MHHSVNGASHEARQLRSASAESCDSGSRRGTITVELTGGLANQLFQWAAGEILAKEFETEYSLDARKLQQAGQRGYQLESILTSDAPVVSLGRIERFTWRGGAYMPSVSRPLLRRISMVASRARHLRSSVVCNYAEARDALGEGKSIVLASFFQEPQELLKYRDFLRSKIKLPEVRGQVARATGGEDRYVAAHVRRGDYVSVGKYLATFGICSESYYTTALAQANRDLPVLIATDDRAWTQDFIDRSEFSGSAMISGFEDHYSDLSLLASAGYLVMSNSTFSWWAAFLGEHEAVFAPEPWFTDRSREHGLYLDSWVKIDRD